MKRLATHLHKLGYVVVGGKLEVITQGNKPVDESAINGLKLNTIVNQRSRRK